MSAVELLAGFSAAVSAALWLVSAKDEDLSQG
jgi:hypothetical protein